MSIIDKLKNMFTKNNNTSDNTAAPAYDSSDTTIFVANNSDTNGNTQYLFTQTKGPLITLTDCTDDSRIVEFRTDSETVLGRSDDADIIITFDNSISKKHCTVSYIDKKVMVNDLKSANKTYINNIEITQLSELRDGDILRLGRTSFNVEITPAANE